MTRPLPERAFARLPGRLRARIPDEIPALWRDPPSFRVLVASAVSMFALAIFPPFLSPGAEAIQTNLKQDPGSLGLVVLAGIALGAGTMLVGGAIGDVAGHRRWLLIGLAGLLATCLFGVLVQSDGGLIAAGLLGAFWSGFALPMGIAVVADAFPDRTVQDVGIGLGLAAMAAAQIVAPVVQDVLHGLLGTWAIYLLPAVSGALALHLVLHDVPDRRTARDVPRRHVIGQALLAAIPLTVASLLILLLPGEADVLALIGLVVLGGVALVAAGLRRRRGAGVLPAGATPGRMILVALFVGVFMSFALNAPMLYFGTFLRVVRDWSEILAIVALVPHIVPLLLGGLYAPVLTRRFGYVRVILASMLILAASTAAFAVATAETAYWWFVLPLAFLGLGMIFGATARSGLIMSRMPTSLPGLANALNLASMELGAILGQTVTTVMVMRFASERYAERLDEAAVEEALADEAIDAFRDVLGTVQPGGTTELEPSMVQDLLPGFRESMADGISLSLWGVTVATLAAFAAAALLFRWARGKDERPAAPIELDPDLPG